MIVGVHFTEASEFLDELDKHAANGLVERGIVRATPCYQRNAVGLNQISVVASFVSTRPDALPELVHVTAVCGELWGHDEKDAQVRERRDAIMASITSACERHELELRAGWYEATVR